MNVDTAEGVRHPAPIVLSGFLMTVEDLVVIMGSLRDVICASTHGDRVWVQSFLRNTAGRVERGGTLSTEQAKIVLRLAQRFETLLIESGRIAGQALAELVRAPVYRNEPYPSANVPREVRHLGQNLLGFRFKYNEVILEDIKRLAPRLSCVPAPRFWYHREHRIWVVPTTRDTLDGVQQLITKHRFEFDDAVVAFLTEAVNAQGRPCQFALDPALNVIAGLVPDNDLVAWVVRRLGGEPV